MNIYMNIILELGMFCIWNYVVVFFIKNNIKVKVNSYKIYLYENILLVIFFEYFDLFGKEVDIYFLKVCVVVFVI